MHGFTITPICDIFLNRHLSYSLGSDLTEFGLVSSHGYVSRCAASSRGLLSSAQGPLKRSSLPNVTFLCSFPPLLSAFLTVGLQFRPPNEALSSIKCTKSSMSIYPLSKVPISSPGPGHGYTKNREFQLSFKARNTSSKDYFSIRSLQGILTSEYQDSNLRHCFTTHKGPAQATTHCLGTLKTLKISLKTDNMCETFRAAQDVKRCGCNGFCRHF
jgi:hypothetical protein